MREIRRELDAVIKSFELVVGRAAPAVVSWLTHLQTGERIDVTGLYELLVRRRLLIAKELFEPYKVEVEWVATDVNPADKLTRAPADSGAPVSAAGVIVRCSLSF